MLGNVTGGGGLTCTLMCTSISHRSVSSTEPEPSSDHAPVPIALPVESEPSREMNDPGSSRQVAIPQLGPPTAQAGTGTSAWPSAQPGLLGGGGGGGGLPDVGAEPSFQRASQAQIIRAHQRDSAQVHRLTELASEIARSIAGGCGLSSRWLLP